MTNKAKTKAAAKNKAKVAAPATLAGQSLANKVVIILGADKISTEVSSIVKATDKLYIRIHQVACSIVNHLDVVGSDGIGMANHLVKGLGDGIRADAMYDWFLAMGKCRWDAEERRLAFDKDAVSNIDEAIKVPFWAFSPPPAYKPLDLMTSITQLIKKAEQRKKKGVTEQDNIPQATLNALKKLVSA